MHHLVDPQHLEDVGKLRQDGLARVEHQLTHVVRMKALGREARCVCQGGGSEQAASE